MMSSWILGLILILISNLGRIISKVKDFDTNTNKPFYGFKHMRKAISLSSDNEIVVKLKKKILIRKIGYYFLIITPVLFILGGIFGRQ